MDQVDLAQLNIERGLALAQQGRAKVAPVGAESALECDECGLAIPEGRRLAVPGTQHCTECASLLERGLA